jgi:hypothetical protein
MIKHLKQLLPIVGYLLVFIGVILSFVGYGGELGTRTAIGGLLLIIWRERPQSLERRVTTLDKKLRLFEDAGIKQIILNDATLFDTLDERDRYEQDAA